MGAQRGQLPVHQQGGWLWRRGRPPLSCIPAVVVPLDKIRVPLVPVGLCQSSTLFDVLWTCLLVKKVIHIFIFSFLGTLLSIY